MLPPILTWAWEAGPVIATILQMGKLRLRGLGNLLVTSILSPLSPLSSSCCGEETGQDGSLLVCSGLCLSCWALATHPVQVEFSLGAWRQTSRFLPPSEELV